MCSDFMSSNILLNPNEGSLLPVEVRGQGRVQNSKLGAGGGSMSCSRTRQQLKDSVPPHTAADSVTNLDVMSFKSRLISGKESCFFCKTFR